MRFFFITAILLASISASYGGHFQVSYPGFDPNDLGKSINVATGNVLGDCMAGDLSYASNRQISHGLDFSNTSINLHRRIHGTLSASLSIGGLLGVGSSVEFTKDIQADLTSATVVFNILYKDGSVFLDDPIKVADSACHRYYVSGYTHGAILAVGLKIRFKSKEELKRFKSRVSSRGLFGLLKGSRTKVKEIRKLMESATMTSRISLEGAIDEDIAALGNKRICHPKDIEKCLEAISAALALVGPGGGFAKAVERFNEQGKRFVLSVHLRETGGP